MTRRKLVFLPLAAVGTLLGFTKHPEDARAWSVRVYTFHMWKDPKDPPALLRFKSRVTSRFLFNGQRFTVREAKDLIRGIPDRFRPELVFVGEQ